MDERLAIVGSGAIACGLAATAAHHGGGRGPVLLLARSQDSAERARATVERTLSRLGADVDRVGGFHDVQIVTDPQALAQATFVVEAVVEDAEIKAGLLAELNLIVGPEALLASTTSSLSVQRLAQASGRPGAVRRPARVQPRHEDAARRADLPAPPPPRTRGGERSPCARPSRSSPVEVPDIPGFVVNRLLFPYLFSAVRCSKRPAWTRRSIDTCMQLGAGHPMGPLALLDLIGLDVSKAIGETIGETIPARIESLVAEGALGRKSGRGFHAY